MNRPKRTPLILFSGLAADSGVFVPQRLAFPQLVVPPWPVPDPQESLDAYCRRIAAPLGHHRDAITGGASFGGIVALHVAKYLKPRAVVLIGSVRCPSQMPPAVRLLRPLRSLVPMIPVRPLQLASMPLASRSARRLIPHIGGLARQFQQADPAVLKWSVRRILDWSTVPTLDCPVFQIHGSKDRILPMRYNRPDSVVSGGGHVISLTHPADVNDFIGSVMQTLSNDSAQS